MANPGQMSAATLTWKLTRTLAAARHCAYASNANLKDRQESIFCREPDMNRDVWPFFNSGFYAPR